MPINKLLVKFHNENAKLPNKDREEDEGYDIFSCEELTIEPGKVGKVHTGISAYACEIITSYGGEKAEEINTNKYWLQIEGRSGLASKGIFPVGGIIDSGYRGEIMVAIVNFTNEPLNINIGDKIAQLIIREHINASCYMVDELPSPKGNRGAKGFGSSGI